MDTTKEIEKVEKTEKVEKVEETEVVMDEARAKKLARDMLNEWDKQLREMKNASEKVDWSGTDWSKLNPKDVGVRFGPAMTEEQFAEYRKNRNVNVIRGTGAVKPEDE
jgi:hypothetical protein